MQIEGQEIIKKNITKLIKQQFCVLPKGGGRACGGTGAQGGTFRYHHYNHCINIKTAVQQVFLLVQDRHEYCGCCDVFGVIQKLCIKFCMSMSKDGLAINRQEILPLKKEVIQLELKTRTHTC